MKKFTFALLALGIAFAAQAKTASDTTVCFTVEPPMSCVNCENKIKSNLRFEKGVKEIDASATRGTVEVKFNTDKTDVKRIVDAFGKIGYKATPSQPAKDAKATCGKKKAGCCEKIAEKCGKGSGCCEKKAKKCDKTTDCKKK